MNPAGFVIEYRQDGTLARDPLEVAVVRESGRCRTSSGPRFEQDGWGVPWQVALRFYEFRDGRRIQRGVGNETFPVRNDVEFTGHGPAGNHERVTDEHRGQKAIQTIPVYLEHLGAPTKVKELIATRALRVRRCTPQTLTVYHEHRTNLVARSASRLFDRGVGGGR